MTIQVHSEATGRMEDCTIATGVLGSDGIRYGAMADIDAVLFTADVVDETPLDREGLSDKILRAYQEPARVQKFEYTAGPKTRKEEQSFRADLMARIAPICEQLNISPVFCLPKPRFI